MIRRLSAQRFLLLLLTALSFNIAKAQITITTNYTSFAQNALASTTAGTYPLALTFIVQNDTTIPIAITSIGAYNAKSLTVGSWTFTNDSATWSVWYGPLSAPTSAVTTANGWQLGGSGPNIYSASNGITDVLPTELTKSGRKKQIAVICPKSFMKFVIVVSDTLPLALSATPTTFTPTVASGWNNKVILNTGGASYGIFPNVSSSTTAVYFEGSITFEPAYPQPPTLTAVPNPICVGGTSTLTATNTTCPGKDHPRFHWQGPGIPPSPNDTGAVKVVTVNAPSVFKCYIQDDTTGLISDTASIAVTPVSDAGPVVAGKFDYCFNEQYTPITVDGLAPSDPSVVWYFAPVGGSPMPAEPTVNTTIGVRSDTFYVSVIRNGCPSQRTRVVYRVSPKPVPPIVTTPIYYCAGTPSVPITANGQNLRWYYAPTGGIASELPPVPPTSVLDTFDYYVSQNNNGCESERSNIHVVVTQKPNGLILTSVNELCAKDTVTFNYYGGAFAGAAYNWGIPDGATYVSGSDTGPIVVSFEEPGIHTVTLQVGNYGCYSQKYEAPITVDSLPYAVISAQKDLCRGRTELISLDYWDKSIDTFIWDFAGGVTTHYATDQGPYGVYWDTAGLKNIKLIAIDGMCRDSFTVPVDVHQYPVATIDIEGYSKNKLYCAGDSIRMVAHYIDPSAKYTWTPARFFDTYSDIPAVWGRVDFDSYVRLDVVDQYGCANSDSLLIKTEPCCNLIFPTAFTPNGDKLNDVFHMLNNGHYDVKTFHIANRWGVTVFETTNERNGWDGTFNGKPQDMGTYYYYISYMCGKNLVTQKGEFVLIR